MIPLSDFQLLSNAGDCLSWRENTRELSPITYKAWVMLPSCCFPWSLFLCREWFQLPLLCFHRFHGLCHCSFQKLWTQDTLMSNGSKICNQENTTCNISWLCKNIRFNVLLRKTAMIPEALKDSFSIWRWLQKRMLLIASRSRSNWDPCFIKATWDLCTRPWESPSAACQGKRQTSLF